MNQKYESQVISTQITRHKLEVRVTGHISAKSHVMNRKYESQVKMNDILSDDTVNGNDSPWREPMIAEHAQLHFTYSNNWREALAEIH